jgi:hypothetical protein
VGNYHFELATEIDDQELKDLLARNAMPSSMSISFRREPSYFAASKLDGPHSLTIVCRERSSNRIVGIGSLSVRERFYQEQIQQIGYLSSLRLDVGHRNMGLVARGFRFFRQLQQDPDPLPISRFYFTTIADGNKRAVDTLVGGRAGLPLYHRIATWNTYALSMVRLRIRETQGADIRPIHESEIPSVVRFLNTHGSKRNFFPPIHPSQLFASDGLFPGLDRSMFFVARVGDAIVGTFGLWDQSSMKQIVVEGYSSMLRIARPLYNRIATWRGDPLLPNPGETMPHQVGCLLVVQDNRPDVAHSLVASACQAYMRQKNGGGHRLLLGFDSRCPLQKSFAIVASQVYATGIYLVSWEPSRLRGIDEDRWIYLELGCL